MQIRSLFVFLTITTESCVAWMQSSSSHAFVVLTYSSSSSWGSRVFKGCLLAVVGTAAEPGCSSVTSQLWAMAAFMLSRNLLQGVDLAPTVTAAASPALNGDSRAAPPVSYGAWRLGRNRCGALSFVSPARGLGFGLERTRRSGSEKRVLWPWLRCR